MLVAGSMIGSGIFIVSADIARDVGSTGWLMLVWLLAGLLTMIGVLSYAELAAMMPQAGGQYVYLREAYGPLWGFLYGWSMFLVIQTGTIAAVAVSFAKFFGVLVPSLGTDHVVWRPLESFGWPQFGISAGQFVAVAVVVFLTVLNCRGIEQGKWVQNIFTVAKTLALLLLVGLVFTLASDASVLETNLGDLWSGIHHTPRMQSIERLVPSGWLAILMVLGGAMVGSLFASDAWHNVTFAAAEIRNPRRNLPLGMVFGTALVTALYLLVNVTYLATLPIDGAADAATPQQRGIAHVQDDRVGTAVLEIAAPRLGVPLMAVAVMISTFGCANGMSLMGARLYYAMAQDGLFFRSIGHLNRNAVPAAGLVFQGCWTSLLIFSGTYSQLLDYVIFTALLFYQLTVVGLFVLRRKRPEVPRPYRAFGYPWLPALYVLLCGLIMLDLLVVKPLFTWPGLLIVLSGIPVYFLWRRRDDSSAVSR